MPFDLVAEATSLALARHGEVEGVAHHALAALLGEHRHLDRLLELGALERAPADRGILALVVLAHDEVVDVAGLAVGERRFEAVEEPHGAQVDVLLEAAADRDQQAPQRDVVGHAGPADGAQIDGVVLGDLVEPVGRHHGAGLGEALARPVEMVPGVVDAEAGADRLQHADALGHHLVADAVAGDDGDPEFVGRLRRGRRDHRILLALLRSSGASFSFRTAQAMASRPLALTSASSFSEGPDGSFSPRSHSPTNLVSTLR